MSPSSKLAVLCVAVVGCSTAGPDPQPVFVMTRGVALTEAVATLATEARAAIAALETDTRTLPLVASEHVRLVLPGRPSESELAAREALSETPPDLAALFETPFGGPARYELALESTEAGLVATLRDVVLGEDLLARVVELGGQVAENWEIANILHQVSRAFSRAQFPQADVSPDGRVRIAIESAEVVETPREGGPPIDVRAKLSSETLMRLARIGALGSGRAALADRNALWRARVELHENNRLKIRLTRAGTNQVLEVEGFLFGC